MLQSVKISELPSAETLTEDDLVVIDQPDDTKKATLFQVKDFLGEGAKTSVLETLAQEDGLKNIGQCQSIEDLRGIQFSSVGQQVFLREHTVGQGAGGGIFYCHSLTSDSTYIDDNGCQIINDFGQVIRRKDISRISLDMFGSRGGMVIDTLLDNGYKATRTFCKPTLFIPELPPAQAYYLDGGKVYSVGQTETGGRLPFFIVGEGEGLDYAGPIIRHTGDNIGITIQREPDGTTPRFWVCGGVLGVQFIGTKPDGTGVNTGANAVCVRISDGWNFKAKFWVSGYTNNNCALSVYNRKAYTEGGEYDLMVRQSMTGVKFHRNTEAGSTATDSFFRTNLNLDFNAGVSGAGVTGIVLGDGTSAGKCFMYGHHIRFTMWMSNGSWHNGIFVSDYSQFAKDGKVEFIADGYGLSRTVVPASEVVHLIRLGGQNAQYRSLTTNMSMQGGGWGLNFLNLIFQSCMYTKSQVFYPSSVDVLPPLNPVGMEVTYNGKFSVEDRISGKIYTLDGLLPGMRLLIDVTSWKGNDQYANSRQTWNVEVRGTDEPCIVVPVAGSVNLTTTSSTALTSSSGDTDIFLKSVVQSSPRLWLGGDESYALTVKNSNDNNSIGYAPGSGRKIRFVLPPYPGATAESPYSVSIKVV